MDRALERQDLSRDGLLDPPELLLYPSQGPPEQPLQQHPGEPLEGDGAGPGGDTAMPVGDTGVSGPGHGQAEQAAPQAEAPSAGAREVEEAPDTDAMEVEEASEAGAPEGEAAPVWGVPGEG